MFWCWQTLSGYVHVVSRVATGVRPGVELGVEDCHDILCGEAFALPFCDLRWDGTLSAR
jgi:hypothetical protein